MNPIDPVNYLSCTILGLKTALFEAEKENQCLQKLLLSFYVKDAAKETDLYKMNRTGVKMNVLFQKEKQDLSLKIQELEARLADSESENLNLNFQVRELKAFLEEKTNLLKLYNPKDTKSEKLLLNNLKEKDLIQIIRNVLVCMKKGRVSRALQKSLRRLEQRKDKNSRKIKTEDTDAEMSDSEIDLMSTMIENRLEADDFSFKCGKNELSGPPSIRDSFEMPAIDLNESDIIAVETNSSRSNGIDRISMDQSIFSPLSIADSDYSSNGVKSVESLNSEKVQSAESGCGNILLLDVDTKPSCESSIVLVEAATKSSCETDILEPKLNFELKSETALPVVSGLKLIYKIDVLPAGGEVPKLSCETDILPGEKEDPNPSVEIDILPGEKEDPNPSRETDSLLTEKEDPNPSCETDILPAEKEDSNPSFEIDILPTETKDLKPSCETDILPAEKEDLNHSCETDILPAKKEDSNPSFEIDILPTETKDPKPSCETDILPTEKEDPNHSCETDILPAEKEDSNPSCETDILPTETKDLKSSCETDILPAKKEDPNRSCETDILPPKIKCNIDAIPAESIVKPSYKTDVFPEKEDVKPKCETNITSPRLDAKPSHDTNISLAKSHEPNCKTNPLPVALDAKPSCDIISRAERDTSVSTQKTAAHSTEACVDIQSDSVADPEQILEYDPFIDPKIVNSAVDLIISEMSNICYSRAIVEAFGEFCKNDIRLNSDKKIPVCFRNTVESVTSGSATSNLAIRAPQDVGCEIPVKRKTDDSSQNSFLKKIRLNENVTNLPAESGTLALVPEESTKIDKIQPSEGETNPYSLEAQDDNSEINSKLEHQKDSIPNNAVIQDAFKSPDVLLPHPDALSEIGALESQLDKPVIFHSDIRVSPGPQIKSIFDVETNSTHSKNISVLDEETSVSKNPVNSSISVEKKSDSDAKQIEVTENKNQVGDTESITEEEPAVNSISSICEAGTDLFRILNEFATLEKVMHRRMTVFKEFLQQDDHSAMEMLDKMEYIVVAEILENCDLELSSRETFIDGSCLPDDILNSLHKTNLKTVEFETSEENLNSCVENRSAEEESFVPASVSISAEEESFVPASVSISAEEESFVPASVSISAEEESFVPASVSISAEEEFFVPASDSMTEVNDTSDDEKDELIIVEDDHIGDKSVDDTAANKGGVFRDEENNRKLVAAAAAEKRISDLFDVHSVSRRDQPIKEITNIPRYNFRRSAASTESPCETSRSLPSVPVENPRLFECNRESTTCTAEEPSKSIQMQFYVENQTPTSNPSLYVSAFDEVWSQIKSNWYQNSAPVTDTTDLISCKSSIMKLVFVRKDPRIDVKIRKEKVLNLASTKTSLELFLKEKIRSFAQAFDGFSSTVSRSNKTTLCCAMIEIISDSVTSKYCRRNENILRDFVNLSDKLNSTLLPGFVDALKNELKTRMWVKTWKVKENGNLVSDIRLLSNFFTKLCRWNDDSLSVISLLRETLFSFKFRGHPIAFSVLNEWPDVFPRDVRERNLLVHIILFTLINHRMGYNKDLYNVVEVQRLINDLFNVKLGMKTAEEYAKELMLQFYDATWKDAITLLCKRQMFPWTYSNVIMKYLLPILRKWKTEFFPEEILTKVLRTLKTLLGACPFKDEENGMFNLDLIVNVLAEILSGHKGSRELKETVILVLCDLSIYRFPLCVEILENWKPAGGVIRRSTFLLLRDQLTRYKPNWISFLFPKRKWSHTRENKREKTNGSNGSDEEGSSRPNKVNAVIAVGVSRKINKNRPLSNKLLKDNPIPGKGKKKKNSKKKGKTRKK